MMDVINPKLKTWRILGLLLFLSVLLFFPLTVNNPYLISILIIIALHGIVSTGLCLLLGFTGQISIAQAAFYGIGAYTSAILTTNYGLSPWVAIVAGCALSAVVALFIGFPTLKLEENYLALATLGFGIIVYIFFMEVKALTGGPSGITGIPVLSLGNFAFDTDLKYYYLVWLVALGLLLFSATLVRSRVGRALRAIRGSELAAESIGINSTGFKVKIFILSAVYASLAGSLYAHYVLFISPSPFYVTASIHFVIIAVFGGLTNIWGGLLGAAVITGLGELIREVVPVYIPEAGGEYEMIVFGVILIATMIFMPQGLAVAVRNKWVKWVNAREGQPDNQREAVWEGEREHEEPITRGL
jgi:branched-chain amino acid transport system permease protein